MIFFSSLSKVNDLQTYTPIVIFLTSTLTSIYMKQCILLIKNTFYPPLPPKDPIADYLQKQQSRFYSFQHNPNKNKQLLSAFYNKKELIAIMNDPQNEVEKSWKTKILMESTPRGNIIMSYDPFKFGFSYYCDQKVIPYDILNAMAMKYTKLFECYDFFSDTKYTLDNKSILWDIHIKEEKKKESKTNNDKKNRSSTMKDAPFIKRKPKPVKAKPNQEKEKEENKKKDQEEKEKEDVNRIYNKFIYLGKVSNFSFLNKPPVISKAFFSSPYTEMLNKQQDSQKERLSYKLFKESLNQST